MRAIVALVFGLTTSVLVSAAEVTPGFYVCQQGNEVRGGTATFKVTYVTVPGDQYMPAYYVDATYQAETKSGKELFALRGLADVMTDAMGNRHLMLGNAAKSLTLTIENHTAYTQIGSLKMDCRIAK
jgi:hypothetical protein